MTDNKYNITRNLLKRLKFIVFTISLFIVFGFMTTSSPAILIQDLIRIKGQEPNWLRGIGLVTGLDGTGGSTKKSDRLKRPLLVMYSEAGFGTTNLDEMSGIDSVAAVEIWCEVPGTGAREGDRFDVHVTVVGDATSLEGGMLMQTPLKPGRGLPPFAVASGRIELVGSNNRHGIIHNGAQMLRDIRTALIPPGGDSITLVIDSAYAEWSVAEALASHITQEFMVDASTVGDVVAVAEDNKNIVVHMSSWLLKDPSAIISRIQTLDIDPALLNIPAKVLINREAGIILVTADVEISPIIINSRGLSITRITPQPVATPNNPLIETTDHIKVQSPSSQNSNLSAKLDDLLQALESLKVPFEERVAIIRDLKNVGALKAKIIEL